MEADKIEYYTGGDDEDFILTQAMNDKIILFTKFLVKTGIDFEGGRKSIW